MQSTTTARVRLARPAPGPGRRSVAARAAPAAARMRAPAAASEKTAAPAAPVAAPAAAAVSTVRGKGRIQAQVCACCVATYERRSRSLVSHLSLNPPSQASFFLAALPALAEDAATDAAATAAPSSLPFGFSPIEVAIAVAPLAFYAVLTVYRSAVNPKASISDVLFLLAAFLIVGNLIAGLVFKVRLF